MQYPIIQLVVCQFNLGVKKIIMKKLKYMLLVNFLCCGVAVADKLNKFGVGVSSDDHFTFTYNVSDSISVKYGFLYLKSNHEDDNASYIRKYIAHSFVLRGYVGKFESYNWFYDIGSSRSSTNYEGESNRNDIYYWALSTSSGLEYYFNFNVSIAAKIGIEYRAYNAKDYKSEYYQLPTTALSMNYFF